MWNIPLTLYSIKIYCLGRNVPSKNIKTFSKIYQDQCKKYLFEIDLYTRSQKRILIT